jgi:hypothetical protein
MLTRRTAMTMIGATALLATPPGQVRRAWAQAAEQAVDFVKSTSNRLVAVVRFLRAAACHGVFLAGITRTDRNLAPLPRSKVHRGDVLRLIGKPVDVARAAQFLGEAEIPSNLTGFVYLGGGLVIGILIGMVPVPIAGATLSLGSADALLSGLVLSYAAACEASVPVRRLVAGIDFERTSLSARARRRPLIPDRHDAA